MDAGLPMKRFSAMDMRKFDIEIRNEWLECRVFWARIVASDREGLLTQYTKHTFYEVQYALEGRIDMLLDNHKRIDLAESDFIVIPPDTYHQIIDSDQEGARFIMAFSVKRRDERMRAVLDRLSAPIPCRATVHMRTLLELLMAHPYTDDPVRRRFIITLLEVFLLEMFETLCPGSPQTLADADDDARIEAILACVRDCHGVGIRVCDIARRFNLSERHLCRIVCAATGQNLRELIQHEKLQHIEALIASTDLSLCEIAGLCGFSDVYAMNRFFRRYNLTNLSTFRRLSKNRQAQKSLPPPLTSG